ncbi:uncharacterized protein LOC142356986, partial [Convolutriloba macropyga]|uniref:uncharacterized protein LOC142356986 n=1 Tax=Convolutriloba macropyga TaxID=536237 RepID=UPI003F51B3FE
CNCAVSEVDDRWRGVSRRINEELDLLSAVLYCLDRRQKGRKKFVKKEEATVKKRKKEYEKLIKKIQKDPPAKNQVELKAKLVDVERMVHLAQMRLRSLSEEQIKADIAYTRERVKTLEEAASGMKGWIYIEEERTSLQKRS